MKGKNISFQKIILDDLIEQLQIGIEPLKGAQNRFLELRNIICVRITDIQQHCLDKQKVRDVIELCIGKRYEGTEQAKILLKEIKKELGL